MELDEYLGGLSEMRLEMYRALERIIRKVAPDVRVSMRYRMPTFERGANWVAVGNQKHYLSLYTCSAQFLESFRVAHPAIKCGKGCINFRDKDDIPHKDVEDVVRKAFTFQKPPPMRTLAR